MSKCSDPSGDYAVLLVWLNLLIFEILASYLKTHVLRKNVFLNRKIIFEFEKSCLSD